MCLSLICSIGRCQDNRDIYGHRNVTRPVFLLCPLILYIYIFCKFEKFANDHCYKLRNQRRLVPSLISLHVLSHILYENGKQKVPNK